MSWLDPFILFFKNGVQLPPRRRVALGEHLTATDDPANDQLLIDAAVGGSGAPVVVTASGADHTFNGDGSGGAIRIYANTILFTHVDSTTATFDFDTTAVTAGFTVFFYLEGTNGHVVVRDLGAETPTPIMLLHTQEDRQLVGIFFDGEDWAPLETGSHDDALYMRGVVTTTPGSAYAVDSANSPFKDRVILLNTTAPGTGPITLPPHSKYRVLYFKDVAGHAGATNVMFLRNGGTGKINGVAADAAWIFGNFQAIVMMSNGVDDWYFMADSGYT